MLSSVATLAACYALWIGGGALGLLDIILVRALLLRTGVVFHWGPWWLGAVDKGIVIVLGLVWLVYVIASEGIYRHGTRTGTLQRRVAYTVGPLAALAGVLLAALLLLS